MLRRDPGDRERAETAILLAQERAKTPLERAFVGVTSGAVEASQALDAASSPQLRAIAQYYIGAKALVTGDREQAISRFEQCVSTNAIDLPEYDLANLHLRQLARQDVP